MKRVMLQDLNALTEALEAKGFFVVDGGVCCCEHAWQDAMDIADDDQRVMFYCDGEMKEAFGADVIGLAPMVYDDKDGKTHFVRFEPTADGGEEMIELTEEEANAGRLAHEQMLSSTPMVKALYVKFAVMESEEEHEAVAAGQIVADTIVELGLRYQWNGRGDTPIALLPIKS